MEETKKTLDPKINAFCKKCRLGLFSTPADLVQHTSKPKEFTGNHQKSSPLICTSIFTYQKPWMNIKENTNTGCISCPKCNTTLGAYAWSGTQCSCGSWVCPAFQIHKKK